MFLLFLYVQNNIQVYTKDCVKFHNDRPICLISCKKSVLTKCLAEFRASAVFPWTMSEIFTFHKKVNEGIL